MRLKKDKRSEGTKEERSARRRDAWAIFQAGVTAAAGGKAVKDALKIDDGILKVSSYTYPLNRYRNIYAVGGGKCAAWMARALENLLGDRLTGGWINVKVGHTVNLHKIKQQPAGHPLPDRRGVEGAKEIMKIAEAAGADDLVICLLSGGGSALLAAPVRGVTLSELRRVNRSLLNCGASIEEINIVRKHLSAVKGGRLAQAVYPASLLTLIVSDVVGDRLTTIASGPTVPDPSTFADGWSVLKHYGLEKAIPTSVSAHFRSGMRSRVAETPKTGDPVFRLVRNIIVASNRSALLGSARKAENLGYHSCLLSALVEGDTRSSARFHAALAKEVVLSGHPVRRPACLLSGGETTVAVKGRGKGGRNQEFVLVAGWILRDFGDVTIFSAGTDGTDGPTEVAGAVADRALWRRARRQHLDGEKYLGNNDSYGFFKRLGGLVLTGPTGTNVMDLRIMLVV